MHTVRDNTIPRKTAVIWHYRAQHPTCCNAISEKDWGPGSIVSSEVCMTPRLGHPKKTLRNSCIWLRSDTVPSWLLGSEANKAQSLTERSLGESKDMRRIIRSKDRPQAMRGGQAPGSAPTTTHPRDTHARHAGYATEHLQPDREETPSEISERTRRVHSTA